MILRFSYILEVLRIPWIPLIVQWTIEPAVDSNHPMDGLRSEPRNKKARNLREVSKRTFLLKKTKNHGEDRGFKYFNKLRIKAFCCSIQR